MKVKEYCLYLYPAGTVLELVKERFDKPVGARFEVVDVDYLCRLYGFWLSPHKGNIVAMADLL